MLFDGVFALVRPLAPTIDAADVQKARISYTDVGRSRFQRRRDLQAKWYFEVRADQYTTDMILKICSANANAVWIRATTF